MDLLMSSLEGQRRVYQVKHGLVDVIAARTKQGSFITSAITLLMSLLEGQRRFYQVRHGLVDVIAARTSQTWTC